MRICVVYDCLYPHTIGGAERWYRELALRLADAGHEVTYLTMRQWDRGTTPDLPGVRVVSVAPRMSLYSGPGERRVAPPLAFGAGVLAFLLRHGRRYHVVHTASFPYFSLLAAAAARPLGRYRIVVDWHELWSREYWRDYLGSVGGRVGWLVQALCLRVPQRAFCFARMTAGRLRDNGVRGDVTVLEGEYAGSLTPRRALPAEQRVVFAGRHIAEKRAPAVVGAVAAARRTLPDLRATVFGDGPERERVLAEVDAAGLAGVVDLPGFVDAGTLQGTLDQALCLLHPSVREGYGLVVVEASAAGVPAILVRHPDNAATELVEDGVNGFVVSSDDPSVLADAIVRVHAGGDALRRSTADWFARNAERLSIETSLATVARSYGAG